MPGSKSLFKLLKVKEEEQRIVLLLMGYSFFMGGAVAVFYTVVVASFLVNFSDAALPQTYIAGGVLVYSTGLLISHFQKKWASEKMGEWALLLMIFSIVALVSVYYLTHNKWVFFALFIWNRFFVLVNGLTFWAVVAKVFNLQQAKRLSGLINTGEVVASVIAYLSIPFLIKLVNPDALLILVVIQLAICLGFILSIHRRFLNNTIDKKQTDSFEFKGNSYKRQVDKSYYRVIFVLALLPVFGLFYVEYIFLSQSRIIFPYKESLASFLAIFFGICSGIEFLLKTFLYNRLLAKYGMRLGIIILPVSLAFSFLLASIYGFENNATALFFACIVLARFFMSTVRKAISDPVYQVLYQPIPAGLRLWVQAKIEGRAKAIGGLLAGIFLWAMHHFLDVNNEVLSVIFLGISVFWIFVAVNGTAIYKHIVRDKVFKFPDPVKYQDDFYPSTRESLSYDEVSLLAQSGDAKDRYRAAVCLAESKRFMSFKYLIPLLQDEDENVREAAIISSGHLKREELLPYLFEQLVDERFSNLTMNALVKSGVSVIRQIEKTFASRSEKQQSHVKLLEIVNRIGGAESQQFLRRNLFHPHRAIKEKAMSALQEQGYLASATEQSYFLQELDEYLALYVWVLSVQEDLSVEYDNENSLMQELELEKEQIIKKAFIVLQVLYGSKFKVIQLFNTDQEAEVRDYLIEITDLLLPENVKNKLLPFLESTSREETLFRYRGIFPYRENSVEERLKDIANKDYTRISRWTKSLAVLGLKRFESESVTPVLVAKSIASSRVLSEAALYTLRMVNPSRFGELIRIFKEQKDEFHLNLIESLPRAKEEDQLLICKVKRLRSVKAFSKTSNEEIQRILLQSTYNNIIDNQYVVLDSCLSKKGVSIIVTTGSLLLTSSNIISAGEVMNLSEFQKDGGEFKVTAIGTTEFYLIENYHLKDLYKTDQETIQKDLSETFVAK